MKQVPPAEEAVPDGRKHQRSFRKPAEAQETQEQQDEAIAKLEQQLEERDAAHGDDEEEEGAADGARG